MGVYIKGMTIEQVKTLLDIAGGEPLGETFSDYLVEVKEPHGDLVDVEYLKEHLYQCETNGRPLHIMELNERLACITDVPIVIEAEGYPAFLSKTLGEFVKAEGE